MNVIRDEVVIRNGLLYPFHAGENLGRIFGKPIAHFLFGEGDSNLGGVNSGVLDEVGDIGCVVAEVDGLLSGLHLLDQLCPGVFQG